MSNFKIPLLFSAFIGFAVTTADAVEFLPRFDLNPTCRGATRQEALAPNQTESEARKVCLRKETEARNQLRQKWETFPEEHRTSCVSTTSVGGIPSYVQLQTCLETRRDAGALGGDKATTGQGKPR